MSQALEQQSKRITIVMRNSNDKKLRLLQAKKIKTSIKSVSYSQVVNEVLEKTLK